MKEYKETQHSIHYKSLSDLSFYSAGYEKCKPSYSYGPKYRNYQLIHFVLSGEGTLHINEQTFNSGQYQIILGTGLVNRIYNEVINIIGESNNADEVKYGNSFQRAIRMFSDVFVPIIPVLVATGLFMGVRGLLMQDAVLAILGIDATNIPESMLTFSKILTDTAFAFLPALVCWSTFRNFGGSPVIGMVLGLMLVSPSLPSAYDVGAGKIEPLLFF